MNYAVAAYLSVREMKDIRVSELDGVTSEDLVEYVKQARIVSLKPRDWHFLGDCVAQYTEEVQVESLRVEWPPPMPFPVCWFTADGAVDLREDLAIGFTEDDGSVSLRPTRLLGFLATERSLHVLFLWLDSRKLTTAVYYANGDWLRGAHAVGLLLNAVAVTFDHASVTTLREHRLEGAAARKARRELKLPPTAPVPRAYYTVDVLDRFRWEGQVKQGIVSCGPCMAVGHRHDVRAHWRVLIRRGALADLTTKLKSRLERRGYVIQTGFGDDLPDDLDEAVRSRGVRLREGEYLAVLRVRVKDFIRGPADRPYVPAAWRVKIQQPYINE